MRRLSLALLLVFAACGSSGSAAPDTPGPNDELAPDAAEVAPDAGSLPDDAGTNDADAGDPCTKPGVQRITSLSLDPATLTLEKGRLSRIGVTAKFESGCERNVTGSVNFTVSDPLVAKLVDAEPDPDSNLAGKAIEALAKGTATIEATSGSITSDKLTLTVTDSTPPPPPPATETRGVWVTRFAYNGLSKTAGPTEVKRIIDAAAANGFNTVFFQVRGEGDAYYKSTLVPWWAQTGRALGVDPGWDPLQVAITEAHAKGLKLHAYFNAYSAWSKSSNTPRAIPDSTPQHILKAHPEYTCLDQNGQDTAPEYTWAAADPLYRAHLVAVADELMTNYDIDGIHLDRIRTPGPNFCHTKALDDLYAQKYGTDKTHWADFSRDQITATVEGIYNKSLAKKPKLLLSASVWGIYKKLPGCSTSEGYGNYYQDSVGWMKKGVIDALCPMMYWEIKAGSCTDWAALLDGFVAGANGRQIIAGMHALESTNCPNGASDCADFPRIKLRIDYSRKKQVAGTTVFASAYLDQYKLWDDYLAGPYKTAEGVTPVTHR